MGGVKHAVRVVDGGGFAVPVRRSRRWSSLRDRGHVSGSPVQPTVICKTQPESADHAQFGPRVLRVEDMRHELPTRERIGDLLPGLSRVSGLEERSVLDGPPVRSILVCNVARWRSHVTPAAPSIKGREKGRLTYVWRRRGNTGGGDYSMLRK